ncbi:MAG: hypothetical protein GF399_11995 [Candidatus Coatesbacteria bacterium]|nr:hypothetical protein [Candidatus Coatesbacteria bacterium]
MDKHTIEHFFTTLDYDFNELEDHVWVINADHDDSTLLVISVVNSLMILRLKLAEVPADGDVDFYKQLLKLNMELLHGAVAIDAGDLVLVDTIELEGIHADEIHASVMALEEGAQLVYKTVKEG